MSNDFPQETIDSIKKHFPIFSKNKNQLIYLDSGATTQKPTDVIDSISKFYYEDYATVHRGVYSLSQNSTNLYQNARETIASFIKAKSSDEIIITKGCTEAINIIANAYEHMSFTTGDEILVSMMDHHSAIVPLQRACNRTGMTLIPIPLTNELELDIAFIESHISTKTKLICIPHISNVTGHINPVKQIAKLAHQHGAKLLVDGAQSIAHLPVNVQELECDYFCFSSHKMYGPTGVGVLYGKKEDLDTLEPYQTGGSMIDHVSFKKTTYLDSPLRFEAGTPPIAQTIGLEAAINFIKGIGFDTITKADHYLLEYTIKALESINEVDIIGTSKHRSSLVSFTCKDIHPHDIAACLDNESIAVRVGHHCAQPMMEALGITGTIRISFGVYNTPQDIDKTIATLKKAISLFK